VKLVKHSIVAAFMACAVVAVPAALADAKIGVIDFGRLLEESPQAKAANEAMRAEFGPKQRELQALQASLKAKDDKFQKDQATMTPDQRTRAEKDLRDGARELQRKQQEAQDDLNARRTEESTRLQRALIEEVRAYAKSQNFDLVMFSDATAYSNPSIDITAAVLALVQSHAGATGASSGGSTSAKPAGR
jgi:outer membrane protein